MPNIIYKSVLCQNCYVPGTWESLSCLWDKWVLYLRDPWIYLGLWGDKSTGNTSFIRIVLVVLHWCNCDHTNSSGSPYLILMRRKHLQTCESASLFVEITYSWFKLPWCTHPLIICTYWVHTIELILKELCHKEVPCDVVDTEICNNSTKHIIRWLWVNAG